MKRSMLVLATVLAGLTGEAWGSGFLVARFGGEDGHPTTDSPVAIYFNPAGLALASGTRLYLDGTIAYRTVSYDRPVAAISNAGTGTPGDALDANSGKASLFNIAAVPFAGVATDFGVPNLGVGAAVYVPFGGQAVWDENDDYKGNSKYPGAVDGVQRWWAIEGTIQSIYVTAAGAYRIPSLRLSVGLGANLVLSSADTIRAYNPTGDDDLVNGDRIKEGRTYLKVSDTDFSLGAGVIWEAIEKQLWLGASYQSQPGFGEQRLHGDLTKVVGAAKPLEPEKSDLIAALPDIIRAGARFRPKSDLELRLFGEYVRWSVLKKHCVVKKDNHCELNADGSQSTVPKNAIQLNIPRDWNDAFGVRAGASYWFNPRFELQIGAGYDGNAAPDETVEPSLLDMPKVSATVGARIALIENELALGASYTQIIFFERTVKTGYDDGFEKPSKNPDAGGTYNQSVGALDLNVEYRF